MGNQRINVTVKKDNTSRECCNNTISVASYEAGKPFKSSNRFLTVEFTANVVGQLLNQVN